MKILSIDPGLKGGIAIMIDDVLITNMIMPSYDEVTKKILPS
jgi:hypothetical protein